MILMGEVLATSTATPSPTALGRRCLLLSKSDQPIYPPLLKQLHRRGIQTLIVHDEPAVMTSLSLDQPAMFILHEPAHWPGCKELREAILRYYPGVACWQFDLAGRSALVGLTPWRSDKTRGNTIPSPTPVKPAMKQQERDLQTPLLTREEIDMLLGHESTPATVQPANRQRSEPADHDDEDGL